MEPNGGRTGANGTEPEPEGPEPNGGQPNGGQRPVSAKKVPDFERYYASEKSGNIPKKPVIIGKA